MKLRNIIALFAAFPLACLGYVLYQGPVEAQTTQLGPVVTNATLSTASAVAIAANPSRKHLTFCNPSAVVIWLMPGTTAAAANTGIGLPAASSGTTVCFSTPTSLTGGVGSAWNAIAASATPSLTILEY